MTFFLAQIPALLDFQLSGVNPMEESATPLMQERFLGVHSASKVQNTRIVSQ